jgi:hypothetical protein
MQIVNEITVGQILAIVIPILTGGLIAWGTYLVFRTKTETGLKNIGDQIIDTNRRVSDMAAGAVVSANELRDFKAHVERHFVEKDEIAELRGSFDRSLDRMQLSLELATATMGDVRDSVIALTAAGGKATVPPARRRAPKAGQ